MDLSIVLILTVNGILMTQMNPYGALVYAIIFSAWAPSDVEYAIVMTVVAYTVLLLATMLWKGRSK
jgi:hypothetical protein